MTAEAPEADPRTAPAGLTTARPADRARSALIVIDVQNGVMAAAWRAAEVIATISGLVDRARDAGVDVIWVRHSSSELPVDSPQWQIVTALDPRTEEPIVEKTHGSAFEDTDFETVLASRDIGHLIVAGAQSDACVRSTIHAGFSRGYDVTLVSDAHTTEDLTEWGAPAPQLVVSHTNLCWSFESGPGRAARVQSSDEVGFARPQH